MERTIIDIDAREDHPTIIFFTDRETGYTIACEKANGRVIGCSAPGGAVMINFYYNQDYKSFDTLWDAVLRYQRAMGYEHAYIH